MNHQTWQTCIVLLFWIATLGLGEHMARAVETGQPLLSLAALIEEAKAKNPEIQAARQRWEVAKARIPQVQTLPDPIIGLTYRGPDIMREGRLHLQQEIPFPGKLSLKGEIARKAADQAEQIYRAVQLRVIAQLKEAYFTLHFIQKSIEVVKKNLVILKELEKTAEARYQVGKGIQQDVFRAQVELSREIEQLTALEQERESVRAEINRILNQPPMQPLGVPEEPMLTRLPYTLEDLNTIAQEHSPLLRGHIHDIARGQSAVDLAQREYFPDFVVSLGAMQSFRSADLQDAFGMLGIKVPLYYATKQRFGEKEALADLERARRDYRTVLQTVLFQVKDNFVRAQRAARLVKLIGKAIVPQASLALESSMAGYAVGKVDFLTLLDNVLSLQQDELDLHRQKTDHEIAIAKLEAIIGQPLQPLLQDQPYQPQ